MNGQEQTPQAATTDAGQTALFDTTDFDAALANDITRASARHPEPPPLPTPGAPAAENVNAAPAAPAPAPAAAAAPAAPAQPSATPEPAAPAAAAPAAPAEPAAAPAPAAQTPPAQPAPSQDDEVLDFGSDIKLPRGKVREVLQQYPTLYQNYVANTQEATKFQQIFKMSAAQAEQTWSGLISDVEADPGLADYLQQAWDNYKSWRDGNPVSNAEKMAAEANRRTQQLERESQDRRVRELQQMVDNEKRALIAQHPFLSDPTLWKIVAQHSMVEAARDQTYTLTRGVQDLLPVLQRMAQNNAPTPQPAASAAAATPEAPALLTGSGASPNGTAGQATMEEKQFANLDEAAEDWLRNRRSLGFN